MGWVIPAMMGAQALAGGMGKKGAGKPQTQTTQNNMWDSGMGGQLWDQYQNALGNAGQNVNFGPMGYQNKLFKSMFGEAMGGGGGGGGGGQGQGQGQGAGGGGGGGWQAGFDRLINMGRGGGGGGGGGNKKYAKQNVDYTDYERGVLDDSYMDVASDPLIQKQLEYQRGEFDRNAVGSRNAAMSPFLQAGGTMGLTGAAMGMQGKMQQQNERDWLGQENQMYLGERGQRRGERQAANQVWSGRESTYDSSGMAADAQRAAARSAANASMYGSRLGSYASLQGSQMAANASRYGSDMAYKGTMAGVGAQNAANDWNKKMGMWGMANDMAGMQRQGQGLGQLGLYGSALSQNLPWQQSFGSTQTTGGGNNQGGMGNFLQGMVGGGLQGYGMGKNFFPGSKMPFQQQQTGRK